MRFMFEEGMSVETIDRGVTIDNAPISIGKINNWPCIWQRDEPMVGELVIRTDIGEGWGSLFIGNECAWIVRSGLDSWQQIPSRFMVRIRVGDNKEELVFRSRTEALIAFHTTPVADNSVATLLVLLEVDDDIVEHELETSEADDDDIEDYPEDEDGE